ncbi:unnamed protein product [Aspergillus oryzae var. brunneus]|uniref:Unnamed protein product n=2 Tax=Aspergillus oryzae TaxID=5062 RepID=A0AAN4YWD6_ASPOZ|nr:unnamed protein product [Aspergillus oryzae]GMG52448.1 unnamed protein product [Aspergillus oryzae var. brunneus]
MSFSRERVGPERLVNSFWSYIMPTAGAFVADQYLGRFRTIMYSIAAALLGHLILVISAIPSVISHPQGAIACFSIGLIIMGVGTGGFKFKRNDKPFWEPVKPSALGPNRPQWMTFDDEWVDEVARGLKACKVFLCCPGLAYNQMLNNLTSQAATMHLGGVPNDIINNLNPLALIICIPIFDRVIYPGLRHLGFNFTPIKRITCGFVVAGCSMIAATVIQHYIYVKGPCGKEANYCLDEYGKYSPISVWTQAIIYILGGISEIFASITSLEYAFTKAPKNMRSIVQAVALFMNAFSSAIGQAFVGLSKDPLLVYNYMVVTILAFVGAIGFWLSNYKLDRREDELNNLPQSKYTEKNGVSLDEENARK